MPATGSIAPLIVLVAYALCVAVWFAESGWRNPLFATLARRFQALTPVGKLLAIFFLGTFILRGSTKPGNQTNAMSSASGFVSTNFPALSEVFEYLGILPFALEMEYEPLAAPRLTTNQCRAGFALVHVTTNAAPWLVVPSNAVSHPLWTRYGVAEDTFWLPATNWGYILGTNAVEGLHVSSSGTLSFGWPKGSPRARAMPDGSALNFLAPLQGDIGIAPPQGRFWHAATPSNSLLLTWQDVYAGRMTNTPVTFQTELAWNGDFVFRYAYGQPPTLTNFVIGAQHNGGGETYALNDTNRLANGLELHWRAFGLLDPGIDDHDEDGLSTYDEVMFYGSDPRRPDSDFDGLSDAEELAAGTSPIDPDSDCDGMADGWDPAPLTWSDPDADVDGDGLDALFEALHGLNPLVRDDIDSDNDGWPDWKELLAGTATNSWFSQPGRFNFATELFDATITLHAPLPAPTLLTVGERTLVLRQPRSYTLTLRPGIGYDVVYRASAPGVVDLSTTFSSPRAGRHDPQGIFDAKWHGGGETATARIALPLPTIQPDHICFHDAGWRDALAAIAPEIEGACSWYWSRGMIDPTDQRATQFNWVGYSGEAYLTCGYQAEHAAEATYTFLLVTHCRRAGWTDPYLPSEPAVGEPLLESGATNAAGGWAVAVNNDDDDASQSPDFLEMPSGSRENDLLAVWPLGAYDGSCCPCPEHHPPAPTAELESYSERLALYLDAGKTNAFYSPSHAGQPVFVEGLYASPSVGAEKIVWKWDAFRITNSFTIFSLRLFGDINLDGEVDATDLALHPSLSTERGWIIPAASNVLRKLRLRTDVLVPGRLTLTLSGPAGSCRLWNTATPGPNDTPLLLPGQTVTNGVGGASFATYGDIDLYVEALSNATPTLTYAYTGTGSATGLACSAKIKMTILSVDLDIDSGNMAGTNLPPRTVSVEAIEELGGSTNYPGKIIYMNDMDVDGDQIPDLLDGFGRIQNPIMQDDESSDNIITGGAFIPVVLDCPLPPGANPANARIEFVYEANDPGAIGPMTLAAANWYGTNAWTQNTLSGRIRIWTKNANQTRDPASVASGGNFVPSGTLLQYQGIAAGSATQVVLYVEGIATSPTWGGDKIKVRVYPYGAGQWWFEDQVAYTVVRCVYKVCVYRPYICLRNASEAITNRMVFRTDYSSPSNMVASYFAGQARFDDKGSFHELAAFMGHAFACIETRMPESSVPARQWTGQTGLESLANLNNSYSTLKDGVAWWCRADDGHEDEAAKAANRYLNLYMDPIAATRLYDPLDGSTPKLIAVREIRLRPEVSRALSAYRAGHPFDGYGLDTALNTATNSRIGCGSYIGLLTEYAGLANIESWVFDKNMPIVATPDIWITWLGSGVAYGLYQLGSSDALLGVFREIESEAMPGIAATQGVTQWGASENARNLRFCDPGWMMNWVDQQNAATRWARDQGVTIRHDVPPTSDLQTWRNRP